MIILLPVNFSGLDLQGLKAGSLDKNFEKLRTIFMRSFIALGQELNFAQTQQAYQHINESLYE